MMILPSPENEKKTDPTPQPSARRTDPDPPPQYTPPKAPTPPPETTPASNYVFLQRKNGSIKGTWTIDPRLRPPPALLSPLPEGQPESTRRNIFLHASNGSVSSEISISPASASDDDTRPRVSIEMVSQNGSITSKLHAPPTRSSFFLTAHTSNGGITLSLPRSFRGPICCITSNGSTRLSSAVRAALCIVNEEDGKTMRAFMGSWEEASMLGPTPASAEGSSKPTGANSAKHVPDESWAGDELRAESKNGSVRIQFDDEARENRGSFLGRLFGL